MRDKHVDFLGQDIKAGDFIMYTALWDRSPILKFGLVTRLETRDGEYDYEIQERVTAATLRVISIDRSSWGHAHNQLKKYIWELQKNGQEVTLGFCDRVLVTTPDKVPDQARDVLRKAYDARMEALKKKKRP